VTRSAAAPYLPTLDESGVPGFNGNSWLGLVGRAGTAKIIVDKLSTVVSHGLSDLSTRQHLLSQGVEPVGSSPEQFASFIETETKRYATAAKVAGIQRT
jgi:tripartite-type tricarboxylate transporter receptor subunit TctC